MSIDLSRSSGQCEPSDCPPNKYYPSFHYDGPKELDLPEEGTMTVKFKRTGRSESERDGKVNYSCSIDVLSIESVEGEEDDAPSKSYDDASSALDKIAEALRK
jgi:hypothetical protein